MINGVGKKNTVMGLRIVHRKEIERWVGPEEITLNKLLDHHLRQETDSQSARAENGLKLVAVSLADDLRLNIGVDKNIADNSMQTIIGRGENKGLRTESFYPDTSREPRLDSFQRGAIDLGKNRVGDEHIGFFHHQICNVQIIIRGFPDADEHIQLIGLQLVIKLRGTTIADNKLDGRVFFVKGHHNIWEADCRAKLGDPDTQNAGLFLGDIEKIVVQIALHVQHLFGIAGKIMSGGGQVRLRIALNELDTIGGLQPLDMSAQALLGDIETFGRIGDVEVLGHLVKIFQTDEIHMPSCHKNIL